MSKLDLADNVLQGLQVIFFTAVMLGIATQLEVDSIQESLDSVVLALGSLVLAVRPIVDRFRS